MKNFLKKIIGFPIVLCFFIISIFFGIPALARESQINEFAVAVGVGIDLSENEEFVYDVSFLSFVPIADQTFTETYKLLSAEANSISDAVNQVGLYIGKKFRFAHIKTIVIGSDVLEENIVSLLDYFVRENDISTSTKIVATNGKAKDFMKIVESVDSNTTTKISEIISYNADDLFGVESSIEKLYKGFLCPTKTSVVSVLNMESQIEGLSSSGQGQNSSGQKMDDKKIVNKGNVYILKDGQKVAFLEGDKTKNLNFLIGKFNTGFFTVENVPSNDDLKSVSLEIFSSNLKKYVSFENESVCVEYFLELVVDVVEMRKKDEVVTENVQFLNLTNEEKLFIENQIKSDVASFLTFEKENKIDATDVYTIIFNADKTKFEKFLSQLDDKDDYMGNILFKMNVNLKFR